MKQGLVVIILVVLSASAIAQAPKTNLTPDTFAIKLNTNATNEEKAAIKKMVRWENNQLVAQAGYTFTRVNKNTVAIINPNREVGAHLSCHCLSGNTGCGLSLFPKGLHCESGDGCVCLMLSKCKGRTISLKDIF